MKRPIGVTILAILLVLSGVVILGMQLFFADRMTGPVSVIGSVTAFQISMALLGGLGLAAGIGMWTGRKWGWWLGAFYLTYAIARNVNTLIMLPGIFEQFGEPRGGTGAQYIKFSLRIVVNAAVCYYLFTSKVEEYFAIGAASKKRRLAQLVSVTAIVGIGFAGITRLTG